MFQCCDKNIGWFLKILLFIDLSLVPSFNNFLRKFILYNTIFVLIHFYHK